MNTRNPVKLRLPHHVVRPPASLAKNVQAHHHRELTKPFRWYLHAPQIAIPTQPAFPSSRLSLSSPIFAIPLSPPVSRPTTTMFRSASRAALRNTQSSLAPARTILSSSKRYIGTAPPHLQSRSWRSSAVRWGIAIAGIYYYNTSAVFAENPENSMFIEYRSYTPQELETDCETQIC